MHIPLTTMGLIKCCLSSTNCTCPRLTSCPKLFRASRPPTSKLAAQKLKPEQDYMPEGAEPTEVVEESTEDFFSFAGIPKAMRTRSYVGKIQVCQELAAMYWSLI